MSVLECVHVYVYMYVTYVSLCVYESVEYGPVSMCSCVYVYVREFVCSCE